MLSSQSTREDLQDWLQCCDPNGCHTDEAYTIEFGDPCETCIDLDDDDDAHANACPDCDGSRRETLRAYTDTDEAWEAVMSMAFDG